MFNQTRRTHLKAAGSIATVGVLAGCAEQDDGEDENGEAEEDESEETEEDDMEEEE
jgi:ribosomal protein L12E/L44/L45/RPP1/RPP2